MLPTVEPRFTRAIPTSLDKNTCFYNAPGVVDWLQASGGALRVQRGDWRDPMQRLTQLLLAAAVLLALILLAFETWLGWSGP